MIIKNGVENYQNGIIGEYTMNTELVNERVYWTQDNGQNAIWVDIFGNFVIGKKMDLGTTKCFIYTPRNVKCPIQVGNQWMFYNYNYKQWELTKENEFQIECIQGTINSPFSCILNIIIFNNGRF